MSVTKLDMPGLPDSQEPIHNSYAVEITRSRILVVILTTYRYECYHLRVAFATFCKIYAIVYISELSG